MDKPSVLHNLNRDTFHLPPLNTNLNALDLPNRFIKLIKRLRSVSNSTKLFTLGENLGDLLALPEHVVAALPGVGASYVDTLKELKAWANETGMVMNTYTQTNDGIDTSDFRISLLGVDSKFIKPLKKYACLHDFNDNELDVDAILSFQRHELASLPGFGQAAVDGLMKFKQLIENEISAIKDGRINYRNFESQLIAPKHIESLPIKRIEQLLLDDIDLFLSNQSDEIVDITQKYWGYVDEKETLESIGKNHGLTRERVRQKAAQSNKMLLKCLRLSPDTIWRLIESELDHGFPEKWPDLYSCFSSKKAFYEFLSIICKQADLFNYVHPEIDKSILNAYFAENGAPLGIDDALEYLDALKLPHVRSLKNALYHLASQEVLRIEEGVVWPKLLDRSEASACILASYPKGLPWRDIAKLVNTNSLSRSEIYENRLGGEAFNHPDYIYLAGKGVYRHTNFMSPNEINLDEIFFELKNFINSSGRATFHLNECYSVSDVLKSVGYYEIRHFVKHFGEDYGFYFDGSSQSDSISIEKGFKKATQIDVIIEAMNKREKPYTKPEVASLLKSKSLGHAAFYLARLIEDGRVVQVDRMLYTTPNNAYSKIDLDSYLLAIQDVLVQCGKPVEPSIFKEKLNGRFLESYSKYFYASIARLHAKNQGWQRKHNLYAINEISYKNLIDAIRKLCSVNLSSNENINILQRHIAITYEAASAAITNWRNAPDDQIQHGHDV